VNGRRAPGGQIGQSTAEWVGLLLLVSVVLLGTFAGTGKRLPGASLARTIAGRLVCAVDLSPICSTDPELVAAYGLRLARQVRDHAPEVVYEEGMEALPVDFRGCREPACADGPVSGDVSESHAGEPVTAFVHVVACGQAAPFSAGVDCTGHRSGRTYVQYWFYYPDSATLRSVPVIGRRGNHRDDWESYQVRIGPSGTDARASSHHGHNHTLSRANWPADAGSRGLARGAELAGLRGRGGWGAETGRVYVSGGSHAGNARRSPVRETVEDAAIGVALPPYGAVKLAGVARNLLDPPKGRRTPRRRLRLIPIEAVAYEERQARFAITPPWLKRVYRDPEWRDTQ
jgi:hypothetical protein